MPDMTIAEAAAALGVSVDTIRRRIRRGELAASRDAKGRYVVAIADADRPEVAPREPEALVSALLEEVRHQRDVLERELDELRQVIAQDATERAELRRLLANAQQQMQLLLPAPRAEPSEYGAPLAESSLRQPEATSRRSWWRWLWG